jgi:hypothetical protein
MTTRKPSELRVKRSKRKPVHLKHTALKDQPWYAEAARTLSIKRDDVQRREEPVER